MSECVAPLTLQERRHEWANNLCDAEAYIGKAREAIKRRDYEASREHVFTACFLLDQACQYVVTE